MQDTRRRRVQVVAASAVAALLLIGAAGCGGSSDGGSDGAGKTTPAGGSDSGDSGGSGGGGSSKLPDPCDLVPIEKASEILGGESSKPEAGSSNAGTSARSCSWQTQAGVDNPTLDGAGHILTLQVLSPPETMSIDDFWKASKGAPKAQEADIDGCDEAFWLGGLLSARKDDVYLTATAGMADASPDGKASTTDLVSTACGSLS